MFIGFSQLLIFGFLYWCWPRLLILCKIIRSEKVKAVDRKATVEGDLRLQEGDVCSGCQPAADQEPLKEGAQPQTVSSALHQLCNTAFRFFNFPILREGSIFERILTGLLLQSRRSPAPPLPAASPSSGRQLREIEWRWVLLRRLTVPSPRSS